MNDRIKILIQFLNVAEEYDIEIIKISRNLWRSITMSNREYDLLTAKFMLADRIGEKIQYKELIPTCKYNITMDY